MSKSKAWFVKTRGSYLPNSWQAWLLYAPYLLYMIAVLAFVARWNGSFWIGVFIVIPNLVVASIVMTWIAKRKS